MITGANLAAIRRNVIIYRALRILGITPEGQDPSSTQVTNAAVAMTDMVRTWQIDAGANLYVMDLYDESLSKGDYTFNYDAEGQLIDIFTAYITRGSYNYHLEVVTKTEYDALSDPEDEALPTKIAFDDPAVYIYQATNGASDTLYYYGILKDQNFSGASDNFYFPAVWSTALTYGLAVELSTEYIQSENKQMVLEKRAWKARQMALAEDAVYHEGYGDDYDDIDVVEMEDDS